ncbi:hypothetical protein [uncultured Sphingomonas sp.]|uniref:hypothetical protein n=1 Tax=uncultured Sphingomonas sp. TaxID=158754 RepID=UPI0035CB7045
MTTVPSGFVNPALLARCPERPVPVNALDLPVNVTRWGETGPRVLVVHRADADLNDDDVRAAALGCSPRQSRMVQPAMLSAAQAVRAAGIPTLIITGGYGDGRRGTGEAVAKEAERRHPMMSRAGHIIQPATPDEFDRIVDTFMREAA